MNLALRAGESTDCIALEAGGSLGRLRSLAGRTLMIGLPGPDLDDRTAGRIRSIAPGGVILFRRNLDSPEQTRRLIDRVRGLMPPPSWVAIDQEGGRVSRLEPWIGPTPSAAALVRAGEETIRGFARATAGALRTLGFNLDFAPVVDLCLESATNGIGDRSFGADPFVVTAGAGAFLDALQAGGVAGSLKHFPGLGPTRVDSHETLPLSERSREELGALDLVPFERLSEKSATVMVGHAHYPALDGTANLPATLSKAIVTDLLRTELGYGGLVVSDDLEMGAVAPLDHEGEAACRALEAGCDLLLYCADLDRAEAAIDALTRRAGREPAFAARLDQAAGAVARTARRWDSPDASSIAWAAARQALIDVAGRV